MKISTVYSLEDPCVNEVTIKILYYANHRIFYFKNSPELIIFELSIGGLILEVMQTSNESQQVSNHLYHEAES